MAWLSFHFTCPCGCTYEDLVQGVEGRPDPCPECGGTEAVRDIATPKLARKMIPVYPGYQRMTAGYGHEARRPAEKAGRQVSMAGSQRRGSKNT